MEKIMKGVDHIIISYKIFEADLMSIANQDDEAKILSLNHSLMITSSPPTCQSQNLLIHSHKLSLEERLSSNSKCKLNTPSQLFSSTPLISNSNQPNILSLPLESSVSP
jgi:hypothetical protein